MGIGEVMTRLRFTCPALVLCVLAVGVPRAAESASVSPVSNEQITISSVLLDRSGGPLGNTALILSGLVRRDERNTESLLLGRAVTDSAGQFTITADPSGVPLVHGAVPLELSVVDAPDAYAFVYDFRAFPPVAGSSAWRPELPDVQPAKAESRGAAVAFQVAKGLVARPNTLSSGPTAAEVVEPPPEETLSVPDSESAVENGASTEESWEEPVSPDGAPGGDGSVLVTSGGTQCPGGYIPFGWYSGQSFSRSYKYNYVPTKYFKTTSRASFTWKIGRSNETSFQIAMKIGSSSSAGGFASSYVDSSLSYLPTVGNNAQKIFKIKWRYVYERRYCKMIDTGNIHWLDVYRWMPDRPEAGNLLLDTSSTFSCGGTGPAYVDTITVETSVAKNSTVRYGGFFTIAGVTLDSKQSDSDSQTFTIKPDSGARAKICGSNTTPAYARLVKEMTY